MPNYPVLQSKEATIAKMLSYLGTRWPNPWWPGGTNAYDDCATCVSWALFGLSASGQPLNYVVSGVVERSGLTTYRWAPGIIRGDAVGFLWGGDNNYDHIELALSSPDANGNFQTIGTNAAPNDDMAIRTRNIRYVAGFGRPNYPAPAGGGSTPIGDEMSAAEVALLSDRIWRESRQRLIFDAGIHALLKVEDPKVTRAARIEAGRVVVLPSNNQLRVGQAIQQKASGRSILMGQNEQWQPLSTTEFFQHVEDKSPNGTPPVEFGVFQGNFFELEGGPTWMTRSIGKFEYGSRNQVWADGRKVHITKGSKVVVQFGTKNGIKSAKLADGTIVSLTATEVSRADAQQYSTQVTTGSQDWSTIF